MEIRRVPRPPLSGFVDLLWYLQGISQPYGKERLLPTGTIELVFPLERMSSRFYDPRDLSRSYEHRGALVLGAQSGCVVIESGHGEAVMGVHFKPGGAFPFLGVPASEVQDRSLSLEDIWGAEALWLRERIFAAGSPSTKLDVLEQTLLGRMRTLDRNPSVAFAVAELNGARRVAEVVGEIGISSRRFVQLFHKEVGLTPKVFCRVRRFQEVIAQIENGRGVPWVDLAVSCGYYDQAHFIHDFRNFSGLTPTQYLMQKTDRQNHVAL